MFIIHETLPKKQFEKIMQCPSIKSPPLWYGNGFSPKNMTLLLHVKQMQKKHIFWMKFHPKTLNF
jgi:hypothetical protein